MSQSVAMSADQITAHVKGRFNFTVDKFPLRGPDNMRTPFYGLFRSDTQETVGEPVSERYVAHQTDDVVAIVDAASQAFDGIADVRCHFRDGHYLVIQPTKQNRLDVFGTKDSVFPRVMVRAGYDATAFRASLGMYRDACRNLMRLKTVSEASYSVRHVLGMRSSMDVMIKQFQAIGSAWDIVQERVLAMESTKINLKDLLVELFGEPEFGASPRTVSMHKSRMDAIVGRIFSERVAVDRGSMGSGIVTGWEAYNGVQGWVQHTKTRRNNLGAFDRVILADEDPIVDRAERLILAGAV